MTAYQPLAVRFGAGVGRHCASIFLLTRSLSDGFRLFATGLVLAAVLATLPASGAVSRALLPGVEGSTVMLVLSVGLIGVTTLVYTLLGGMTAVIWSDVIQLVVYTSGAAIAGAVLLAEIPGGWGEVVALTQPAGKLVIFDFAVDLTRSYTFWSGLVGGMFLTAGTHGADQMFVQRYLCSRSLREARLALGLSGVFVLAQFALFLGIGLLLWAFYETAAPPEALASITTAGVVQADRVFPMFLMTHLPPGVRGLVLASILAAAMSTLSSSLNSSAASTIGDFYMHGRTAGDDDAGALRASRWATGIWAVVQAAVALVAIGVSQHVIDDVLRVQFFAGGLMLGLVVLATMTARPTARAGAAGLATGLATLVGVALFTPLSWQWYVLVGVTVTVAAGMLAQRLGQGQPRS